MDDKKAAILAYRLNNMPPLITAQVTESHGELGLTMTKMIEQSNAQTEFLSELRSIVIELFTELAPGYARVEK